MLSVHTETHTVRVRTEESDGIVKKKITPTIDIYAPVYYEYICIDPRLTASTDYRVDGITKTTGNPCKTILFVAVGIRTGGAGWTAEFVFLNKVIK